jgi:hypothetical protein
MNIDKIIIFKKFLIILLIKRNQKIDFRDIIYRPIYKSINNTSYEDVTYQINKTKLL